MPPTLAPLPLLGTQAGFRRFTVPEYHKLITMGVLTEDDNLELLEGYLVHKMARNPPHDGVLDLTQEKIAALLLVGWRLRIQCAITLADSEPEPDIALARGSARDFLSRHPRPADIGLLVEISDSTLAGDRSDKGRIYARASIPCYWIVNLIDRQVEVYTQPLGPSPAPGFGNQAIYKPGDQVPLTLDGVALGAVRVDDILP